MRTLFTFNPFTGFPAGPPQAGDAWELYAFEKDLYLFFN